MISFFTYHCHWSLPSTSVEHITFFPEGELTYGDFEKQILEDRNFFYPIFIPIYFSLVN